MSNPNSNPNSNSNSTPKPTPVINNSFELISPITSLYSNFVFERVVRPKEIDNCLIYANENKTNDHPPIGPHHCACALAGVSYISSDLKNVCFDGYKHAGTNKLISHPDPIGQCQNNIPSNLKEDQDLTAWVIGCLSGIRGKH